MGAAITGDGEGTEVEKGGRYPSHVMSTPTFQPWLRLRRLRYDCTALGTPLLRKYGFRYSPAVRLSVRSSVVCRHRLRTLLAAMHLPFISPQATRASVPAGAGLDQVADSPEIFLNSNKIWLRLATQIGYFGDGLWNHLLGI